ncbi:MAG: amidohydrolase [candidate division Zixibacteria bacterium]|nr:amidohydrolase [candidate division Zixibacteria bacterium]
MIHGRMWKMWLLAVGMATGGCAERILEDPGLLVFGGPIVTMDEAQPEAEAFFIQDGKIKAIGSKADLETKFPDAQRHDLQGRTAIPGIVDSHVHVHELGHDRRKADLTGITTVAGIVERLKAFYPAPEPGKWLTGQGWDEGVWASQGYPDRAELDLAFPDNPVHLESLHGFAGFYNGKALSLAGIDRSTPDPEVGKILSRADGEPTGVMETLAQNLVNRHIPAPTLEDIEDNIVVGLETMASAGVTSVHEAGMRPDRVQAFKNLAAAGRLPIRVYGMLDGNDETLMNEWFATGPLIDPAGLFTVRSIKVFYDGSLGSRTALLAAPYADKPEAANMTERITPEAVASLGEQAVQHGFQMSVHAIGDEGNNRTLGIYEKILKNHPGLDHRWRVEHAQVVLPDYYARAATLGVISSMQSSHAVGDSKWAEDRLGPDRIRYAYAWRRVLEAGGRLAINSDLPGEPWEPMQTLYFAVTRKSLDGVPANGWYPDQALRVEEALRAMTLGGAYAAFQDSAIGSLATGKWADFAELERNPAVTEADGLKDIRVIRVWVAGTVVAENGKIRVRPQTQQKEKR